MLKHTIFLLLLALAAAACNFGAGDESKRSDKPVNKSASKTEKATPTAEANLEPAAGAGKAVPDKNAATAECQSVEAGDNVVLKSQTFAIDFEPFRGSCFVTAHNPEFDEPPMESEMAIYQDGKNILQLPGQFNGVTFGCWVDGVSFQDLNDDNLTDVIVVGKCSAKNEAYNENMVYVNTGKTLTTNADANARIADLKRIKDVADFVKENREMFFK